MLLFTRFPKLIRSKIFYNFSQVNAIVCLETKPNLMLTIGQDGFLKIFDEKEKVCIKSFKIC